MPFFPRAIAILTLLAISLTGCGGSSSGGDSSATPVPPNTVIVSRSTAGTVAAVANGGSRVLTLGFNSSDANPISNLHVTGLSTLPAGWSGAADFSCATVGSGNGCLLNLTYAPAAVASGTFTLTYTYTSIAGNSASGSIDIAFAATIANNIVATTAPAGQVAGIINASRNVTVTFATDDGNPASGLVLTSDLTALPTGWSGNGGATFGCTSVASGNACQLSLVYAPSAIGGGTLALDYSYLDNSGVAKTGTLNIPYTATSNNNVVATPLTATVIDARVGDSATVMLAFTTDDGNAANAFSITSVLPSGWSGATGVTCGGVISANSCQVPFSYAPTAPASGTFTVTYSYSDNSGVAKTGSFDIVYNAKTAHVYVASFFGSLSYCSIGADGSLDSCAVTANTVNGPSGILFHGDKAYVADGTSVYVCNINSDDSIGLCAFTGSAFQSPFMLATTATYLYAVNSTITRCSFNIDGTLTNCIQMPPTGLLHPGGIAFANGTAYITDLLAGTVATCTVDSMTGDFSNCVTAASGFSQPLGITLAGGYAYIADQGANTVSACSINNDGSLGICSSQSIGNSPMAIAFFGNHAYLTSANNNTVAVCDVNLATGVLSGCTNTGDPSFNVPIQLDIH